MNKTSLERQLRQDAHAVEAECPDAPRRRALWRIESAEVAPSGVRPPRWPWLAAATAALLVVALVWTEWPEPGGEARQPEVVNVADLHLSPLMTDPDRLFARREAALERERQLLTRDLQTLRDHVTATFESNAKG